MAVKTFINESQAQVKTIWLLLKGQCSVQVEISEFFPFMDAILTVLDLDPGKPIQYFFVCILLGGGFQYFLFLLTGSALLYGGPLRFPSLLLAQRRGPKVPNPGPTDWQADALTIEQRLTKS